MKTKLSPRKILEKTGATIHAAEDILKNAPTGELEQIEWFTLGRYVTRTELEKEYADRGLEPVNLNTLAEHSTEHDYVATIWDDNGPCYAAFNRWDDGRFVHVRRLGHGWGGDWWFCGTSKLLSSEPETLASESLPSELVINGLTYRRV